MSVTTSNKKDGLKEIYKVTYLAVVNKMIHESKYIDVLQKISMEGFKTYHIDDFDKLAMKLSELELMDCYHISILLHFRDNYYKRISTIATKFPEIGEIFSRKKKKMTRRVSKIYRNIKRKINVIKSFARFNKFNTNEIEMNLNSNNQKIGVNVITDSDSDKDTVLDIDINTDDDSTDPIDLTDPIESIDSIDSIDNTDAIDSDSDVDMDVDTETDLTTGDATDSMDDDIDKFIDANIDLNLIDKDNMKSEEVIDLTNLNQLTQSKFVVTNIATNIVNTSNKVKEISELWMHYNRMEIIDRLHLIVKYYDIIQLQFMDVELKSLAELNFMDYDNLEKYYINTIRHIEKILKTWSQLCKMYNHVERNYGKYCKKLIKKFAEETEKI